MQTVNCYTKSALWGLLGSMIALGPAMPAFGAAPGGASANTMPADIKPDELVNLSLEQLGNIEVTSVSKRNEKASEAAAAIFVVTNEDIRRSGATSIPEVLRMVPGLSVAQAGSHAWAISSRGLTGQFANKLLVLIDGRSVYTPLFSGVYWEVQDTPLTDIERIEVIRGPGATLWGANAVNGVINIITKNAKDTQGGLLTQIAGTQENSLTSVRYGGKLSETTHARMYAKYDDRDAFQNLSAGSARDEWNKAQAGFRVDGTPTADTSFTLQGDVYRSGKNYPINIPTLGTPPFTNSMMNRERASGGNMLARFNQVESPTSNWSLQFYFDNVQRQNAVFDDTRNTLDVDFQHAWSGMEGHEVVWGAGYRFINDALSGTVWLNAVPRTRSDNLFNAFVQDKISILKDTLSLTLGSKFEHNDYSGYQIQPSARLTWLIDDKQTWWASASHAVRTPNRFSETGSIVLTTSQIGVNTYAYLNTVPNKGLEAETLNAFEMGYRIQPLKSLSFDVATFYNRYGDLVSNSIGTPVQTSFGASGNYFIVPVTPVNANVAHSHGVEIASKWDVTSYWQLDASYTYFDIKRKRPDQLGFTLANVAPKQQANLRSTLLLPHNVELTNSIYFVDNLPNIDVPDYVRFDARLAWKPMPDLELSIVGQNLFDPRHPEFSSFVYQSRAQVPRSVYANVTWKF